jgi:MerR HTH family regulatory protein
MSCPPGRAGLLAGASRRACPRATVDLLVSWNVKGLWMRIGEIAGRAGVPAKTIRFWEDQGLLPPPGRTPAGYRDYDPAVLGRLAFIRHAQGAGLTLAAIRQVLEIRDGGQPTLGTLSMLISRRGRLRIGPAQAPGHLGVPGS